MSEPYVPSVEDRFAQMEQTLAVHMMLARALSGGSDLYLTPEDEGAAWAGADHALTQALSHLRAVKAALTANVLNGPAPDAGKDAVETKGDVR